MPFYLPLHWHQDMVPLQKIHGEITHSALLGLHLHFYFLTIGWLFGSKWTQQQSFNLVCCFFGSKKSLWHHGPLYPLPETQVLWS